MFSLVHFQLIAITIQNCLADSFHFEQLVHRSKRPIDITVRNDRLSLRLANSGEFLCNVEASAFRSILPDCAVGETSITMGALLLSGFAAGAAVAAIEAVVRRAKTRELK
jgi:hypothetical protein